MRESKDQRRDPVDQAAIDAIRPHAGWDNGRGDYLWQQFDAVLDRKRNLRARIVWDDNDARELMLDEPHLFFDPELVIECNPELPDYTPKRRIPRRVVPLSHAEAVALWFQSTSGPGA
jgi:hypothetical protein